MLVPSPTDADEVKALIGDKYADETSDLSENSDLESETIVTKSKGKKSKNLMDSFEETLAPASLVSTQSFSSNTENSNPNIVITEAKNNLLLIDGNEEMANKSIAPEKPLIEIQTSHNQTILVNTLIGKSEINSIIDDVMADNSQKLFGSSDTLGAKCL